MICHPYHCVRMGLVKVEVIDHWSFDPESLGSFENDDFEITTFWFIMLGNFASPPCPRLYSSQICIYMCGCVCLTSKC